MTDAENGAINRLLAAHSALEADGAPAPAPAPAAAAAASEFERALGVAVPLPAPELPPMSLADALRGRRSRYSFAPGPLEVSVVGSLLGGALGVSRRTAAYGDPEYPLGVAPSSGGLNSVTAYVVAAEVTGLPVGVYRYVPSTHSLHLVGGTAPGALGDSFVQPQFAGRAPACVLLTVDVVRAVERYGSRHYRVLHVDVGVATQNLYLVATALDLAGCAVAGFLEPVLRRVAALPDTELPALLFPFGRRQ